MVAHGTSYRTEASIEETEVFAGVSAQPNWQIPAKEADLCSTLTSDCDNLEVFSQTAFSILLANVDTCKTKTVKNWKVGIHKGKYGPMGEDLFAEMCLRKNGVEEIDAFDITKDGCCAAR